MDATTACLMEGRFQAKVAWQEPNATKGAASLAPAGTDASQVLWFFDPTNWEMLVKMVDGCAVNGHFWVFSAATTNVAYNLQITDTYTGATQIYRNKQGTSAPAVTDTSAFAGCGASRPAGWAMPLPRPKPPAAAAAGTAAAAAQAPAALAPFIDQASCLADATHGCLRGSRFKIEVAWQDGNGNQGAGQVAPFGSDDSGLFWFFDPTNWEMLVKVLDGCAVNNSFWVFSATTTNVQYTLKVTDTFTGTVKQYTNPQGQSSAAVTDTVAFASCNVTGPPQVEFTSDRSMALRQVGDQAALSVQVIDGNGQPVPAAAVTFTAADPTLVSITQNGPLAATVTALKPPPGSTTITATYANAASADAQVLLAVPASGTVLITSDLVTAKDTLDDLYDATHLRAHQSRVRTDTTRSLLVRGSEVAGGRLTVEHNELGELDPTHWSLGQLATAAHTPAKWLREIATVPAGPAFAAHALNLGLRHLAASGRVQLMSRTEEDGPGARHLELRCLVVYQIVKRYSVSAGDPPAKIEEAAVHGEHELDLHRGIALALFGLKGRLLLRPPREALGEVEVVDAHELCDLADLVGGKWLSALEGATDDVFEEIAERTSSSWTRRSSMGVFFDPKPRGVSSPARRAADRPYRASGVREAIREADHVLPRRLTG